MDDFRKLQKAMCHNGAPGGGRRTYGCGCCRKVAHLGHFKVFSRKLAKTRFRAMTRKELSNYVPESLV
jgi:hypothetical protein